MPKEPSALGARLESWRFTGMSLNPIPAQTSASKRGLFFIGPLVIMLATTIDSIGFYHSHWLPVTWLFDLAGIAAAVLAIISAGIRKTGIVLLRIAGILYAVANAGWDLYETFRGGGPWVEKLAYSTGLPLTRDMMRGYYAFGFHSTISSILVLLLTLTIPFGLVIALLPQKKNSALTVFTPGITNIVPNPPQPIGVRMSSTEGTNAQWLVKMPGQPDNAVDTATLKMWARSGVIRPDTLIVEVSSGMSYQASQIPGVFSSKSYVTALLLSFFLGSLGVDRFYLGQTGLGIGKLLTFGGCGIWSLIDFILIAMRKVTDSDGNPLA